MLREVPTLAGIDSGIFKGHSTARSVSPSEAEVSEVPVLDIMKPGHL